jgi:hypothetical protein
VWREILQITITIDLRRFHIGNLVP